MEVPREAHGLLPGGRFAHRLHVVAVVEQGSDARPHDGVVVDEEHAHGRHPGPPPAGGTAIRSGTCADRAVPSPGPLSTSRPPPSSRNRARIDRSP